MVRPAPRHPYAERSHFGTVHIDPRGAAAALGAAADEIDHRLLEQPHETLHLDAAARDVDERIDDHLPRSVIGDLPAAIAGDDRDAVWHRHALGTLAKGIHR